MNSNRDYELYNDPYLDGYDDFNAGKQFHQTPYAKLGDKVSDAEYLQGMEWRRGWNDAALGRAPSRERLTLDACRTVTEDEVGSVTLSLEVFLGLADYSASVPTGATIGKKWRRREPYIKRKGEPTKWYMGEYAEPPAHEVPRSPIIRWYRISLDNLMDSARMARGEIG